MKKIKNKLQDSHGVSILFALLLMAVAAMVSITIISASISAVKRSHAIKNTRQELLSLDSATLYIEKQLNSDTGASEVSFSQNTDGTYSVTNTNQYGGAFKEEVIASETNALFVSFLLILLIDCISIFFASPLVRYSSKGFKGSLVSLFSIYVRYYCKRFMNACCASS